jgi:hypothetical protein
MDVVPQRKSGEQTKEANETGEQTKEANEMGATGLSDMQIAVEHDPVSPLPLRRDLSWTCDPSDLAAHKRQDESENLELGGDRWESSFRNRATRSRASRPEPVRPFVKRSI